MKWYSLLLPAAVLLAGCVGLQPAPDPTRFYLLTSADNGPPPELARSGVRVGIRRVVMPAYLHPSKIALRRSEHEIIYSSYHRWGESVDIAVSRAVAQAIEQQLQTRYVSVFPWPAELTHDYLVSLVFTQFEGTVEGKVRIAGRWSIIDAKSRDVLVSQAFKNEATWDGKDYGQLAEAFSSVLRELSAKVSEAVSSIEASPE